jgi:hypothetical protein
MTKNYMKGLKNGGKGNFLNLNEEKWGSDLYLLISNSFKVHD